MSGTSLQTAPLVLPNPDVRGQNPNNFQTIVANYSSEYTITFDSIRTLSTNGAGLTTQNPWLFFVPDLDTTSTCINASAPYVPSNVTRYAELPGGYDGTLAIAPWLSPDCTQEYLAAARKVSPEAFIFFLPNSGIDEPPSANDNAWGLGDNGAWKNQNNFPVYAISGADGTTVMSSLAVYSGNMTDVPDGHNLTEMFDSRDYVRLAGLLDTGEASSLPSLWVFLLIVLGILLAVIAITSLLMHLIQRRRRRSLRRRVANGEVDLELLGIKRLTVPQALLDEMPLYTYGTGSPAKSHTTLETPEATKSAAVATSPVQRATKSSVALPAPALLRESSYHPSPLQQPTCAICLDDFVPGSGNSDGTIVRELPCHHIFHPGCVDTFLRDNSSLCPICKRSALPTGYCPRVVTNAMVRRERVMRRMRDRMTTSHGRNGQSGVVEDQDEFSASYIGNRLQARVLSGFSSSRRGNREDSSSAGDGQPVVTEMTAQPPIQPSSGLGRREWARQRAVAMLGRDDAPTDPDTVESQRTPAWRKALRGVFPIAR